jgi:hypothetical protein
LYLLKFTTRRSDWNKSQIKRWNCYINICKELSASAGTPVWQYPTYH